MMKKTSENKDVSKISFIKTNTKTALLESKLCDLQFNFLKLLKTVGNTAL